MTKGFDKLLVVIIAFFLLTGSRIGFAQEVKEKDVNAVKTARPQQRFEPTQEMIDRFLEELRIKDPQKAKALTELREKDPAKFTEEIRNIFREQMRQRMSERGDRDFGPTEGRFGDFNRPMGVMEGREGGGPRGPGGRDEPRPWREMAGERQEEFIKWLGKEYPEDANKLEALRQNPELFDRQFGMFMRKYIGIFMARDNPELVKVLKRDLVLRDERNDLVHRITEAKQAKQREELIAQLTSIISERYDLIVKRTQLEYEQLAKRLEELKKQIEKWKDESFKKERVKEQVKELTDPNRIPFGRD